MPLLDLRVPLRSLRRQPGYALLNVVGLGVGIACGLFLLLYVHDELSYDRYHDDAEQVFRISAVPGDEEIALTPPFVPAMLAAELPGVSAATRVSASGATVRAGGHVFDEDAFFFADAGFFHVLSHPFLQGDARTALARPNTVVLTASSARRYFGTSDAVGRTITRNGDQTLEVTGVIEDVPAQSSYRFDAVASMPTHDAAVDYWSDANDYTFVRARSAEAAAALPARLEALNARLETENPDAWTLLATPITRLHLHSTAGHDLDTSGSIRTVYGFAAAALLILLIACINYVNLSTARAVRRAAEVGLRKSIGASRAQLAGQFYSESVLLTLGGFALAVSLVALGLPAFEALSGKALGLGALATPGMAAMAVGLFALVSVVAGSYPALYVSGFDPVRALRGGVRAGRDTARLRRGLVVFQFGVSAVLVAGTLVVLSQLRYLRSQDLGFDKEHIVVVPLSGKALRESVPALEAGLAETPGVAAVAAVNQIPGDLGWTSGLWAEGMPGDSSVSVKGMPADARVSDALGLRLVAGAAFPERPPVPDSTGFQYLVNTATVTRLGWTPEEAVGRSIAADGRQGTVVGVVADFHFQSMREAIEPLAIWYQPDEVFNLVVRLEPGDTGAAMGRVEAVWGRFAGDQPFAARFLDDVYDRLYQSDQQLGRIVSVFAGLAIFVACLGLFGLASFTAQQRTKEIGVRKVLGASVPRLVGLLTREVVGLVAVAFALAVPLAWLGLARWLDGFAYHVDLGLLPFAAAGAVLLLVALLTVGGQALRAATADPVRALRSE